ncbi:hypothetical protein PHYSODRAFT_501296, partial [Phytophthora sojae]
IAYEHDRLVQMRHYLTVKGLLSPERSSWMKLWNEADDGNLLNVTSLTRSAFLRLLEQFTPFYNITTYSPRGGRPKKLRHHHQVLGLLMALYVGSMGQKALCIMFGVPPPTLSRTLNAAEDAMAAALTGF